MSHIEFMKILSKSLVPNVYTIWQMRQVELTATQQPLKNFSSFCFGVKFVYNYMVL
jgi:hypothetical protein